MSVSESYSNIQWESEEDEVRDEEAPASTPVSESADKPAVEPSAETLPNSPEAEANPPATSDAKETPKKKTYGDMRSELISKFVDRAGKLIKREENKASAKLDR